MDRFKNITKKNLVFLVVGGILIFGAGFWAGYDYKAAEVRKALSEAFSDNSNTQEETEAVTEDGKTIDDFEMVNHKPGEEIEYATIKMKFNSAKSANSINSEYGSPLVADEGTKFVIVNHTVTNLNDSPFSYKSFNLFDDKDRNYNASDDAIGNIDNYLNYRELAPGVPETGVVVFKVPADTTSLKFGGIKGQTSEIHVVEFTVK